MATKGLDRGAAEGIYRCASTSEGWRHITDLPVVVQGYGQIYVVTTYRCALLQVPSLAGWYIRAITDEGRRYEICFWPVTDNL
ncbi:Os07g0450050 [Oryza sativa Japonica Group]|uniref:Os07g0450050 protein n=1 Tax=Oryza sativa subsp. japonica TaxID=39947 RepID=A0A0P0X6B2_ORYSJ|nr:Os07g0450050 [Oryza sativa Japonica Group]